MQTYPAILSDICIENEIATDSSIYTFAQDTINTMIAKSDEIDEILCNQMGENKIETIGVIEHIILRMSLAEMLYLETPPAVMINEAVDIAKKYCAEKSPSLINALLDKIKSTILGSGTVDEVMQTPEISHDGEE
jgi:N utilization substance protein B